ncbi:SRPBCC family protein [Pseudonocardia acaciae]|uniref:SRPBCC family protein n=1 Tax=Pseudonocardia acaciae TaxID=551276 RepID=UPI00048A7D47|nr:SRPBCC family protein [Pseudonocardia acaciae]
MPDAPRRIQVTRTIDAPAGRIFAFLADPDNHPAFDTSGMVRASAGHVTLDAVGTVFVMNMKGDRRVENHVVVYERDRALGWAPAEPGHEPAGHTFVWRLTPAGEHRTVVTQTYDWSEFTHLDMLAHLPVVDRDQLQASLDLLAEAVATTT